MLCTFPNPETCHPESIFLLFLPADIRRPGHTRTPSKPLPLSSQRNLQDYSSVMALTEVVENTRTTAGSSLRMLAGCLKAAAVLHPSFLRSEASSSNRSICLLCTIPAHRFSTIHWPTNPSGRCHPDLSISASSISCKVSACGAAPGSGSERVSFLAVPPVVPLPFVSRRSF